MLKPTMNKLFFAILLLLCLFFPGPAEAQLKLGIVTGTQDSTGGGALGQANALAELLTESLQEEVVVKELTDSATLINWIDRLAMLDLALLSSKDVGANPGRFLSLGKIHPERDLLLVSRQGVTGAWLQRVAEVLREPGVSTAETTQQIVSQPPLVVNKSPSAAEHNPLPVDEVIEGQDELEQISPLSPGRAWTPQEDGLYRDILPSDEPPLKTLVLGVIPGPIGLLRTTEQTQQLALYLEQKLPVSVTIREFASMETFAEGLMRYRMVDLAILPRAHTERNLGRDYQPLVKLLHSDKQGEESVELLIMRRDQNQELMGPLQRTLLDMTQTSDGQDLMKALSISEVLALDETVVLPTVVEAVPESVQETSPIPVAMPEEVVGTAVESTLPQEETAIELDDPVISEPFEAETPFVETIILGPEPLPITSVVPTVIEEQERDIVDETGRMKDLSPAGDLTKADSVLDGEVLSFLGENTVASMIAQPDIPQALRPSGIPTVRPSRASTPTETTGKLIVDLVPKPLRRTFPEPPPQLLPDLVPEPGVIYVIPFAAVMVPKDFNAMFFDLFVDLLNQGGEDLGLQFVILKEDLQRVDSAWLAVRQYISGEIYGYVEDSGCCSTDLRTKARLIYRRPKQELPAFRYEYPVRIFFEHDRSTIDVERSKVAKEIAAKLSNELLSVLRN
jgi:hypothetical protein